MAKFQQILVTCLVFFLKAKAMPIDMEEDDLTNLSDLDEAVLGVPDGESTEVLVDAFDGQSEQNPEELGSYYEGDILMPLTSDLTRNGIVAKNYRWPGAIVPYEISRSFTTRELENIRHAFGEFHSKTCVRFRPRTTERDYIFISRNNTGCWSNVGRQGGLQEVNLQSPTCLSTYGTPMHELMHALGFFHEQNRHERDSYIKVLYDNIQPSKLVNFEKASSKDQYGFGLEYDYASVMHYSPKSFSLNGQPTIRALKSNADSKQMGQRKGFSSRDVRKINAMYKCTV